MRHDSSRFSGHFVRTDPKAGLSDAVADRCIELIRMKRLDAPKRDFVVRPFAGAPGLSYAVNDALLRPEKSSVYDAQSSDSDDDESEGDGIKTSKLNDASLMVESIESDDDS